MSRLVGSDAHLHGVFYVSLLCMNMEMRRTVPINVRFSDAAAKLYPWGKRLILSTGIVTRRNVSLLPSEEIHRTVDQFAQAINCVIVPAKDGSIPSAWCTVS